MSTLIQQVITLPSTSNHHGGGRPFVLLKDGRFFTTETEVGHDVIVDHLMEELGTADYSVFNWNVFSEWYEENLLMFGRIGETSYVLYDQVNVPDELRTQLEVELKERFEILGLGPTVAAAGNSVNFEYIPDTGEVPTDNAPGDFPDRIPWIYRGKNNTLYYSDPGAFHLPMLEELGYDEEHGMDIMGPNTWVGAYRWGDVIPFGHENFTPEQKAEIRDFLAAFEKGEPPPEQDEQLTLWSSNVRIAYKENPWHILRKPFFWNENTNTLTIGEEGTGYLYKNTFTLDSLVPRDVKRVLTKVAKVIYLESDIGYDPWENDREPMIFYQGTIYVGSPGGHHMQLAELIPGLFESGSANLYAFKVSDENAGKAGYDEPSGGIYILHPNQPLESAFVSEAKANFPDEPVYVYSHDDREFHKLADAPRNQAEEYWYRDVDEPPEREGESYPEWSDYDYNWQWWTSWIWDIDNQRLLIQNREEVNHPMLLDMFGMNFENAVYGIISRRYREGEWEWAIVPYYSDSAGYDGDNMPEFIDQGEEVAKAVEAVKAFHKKHRPHLPVQVHESAEIKPLEPDEPFLNWQGKEYTFEPIHLGEERQGVNAYDGADLVGSVTWSDEGDFIYLRSAYVDPGYRGEGLFKQILEQLPQKPIDGDFWLTGTMGEYIDNYNQRFAALPDEEMIESLVRLIFANGGDIEGLKAMLVPNNARFTEEEITWALDQAYAQYLVEKVEDDKVKEEARKLWEEAEKRREWETAGKIEIRWGINRLTNEYWLVNTTTGRTYTIHPNMLEKWVQTQQYESDEMMENFIFGYSDYFPNLDEVDNDSDASYDLYSGVMPTEEEYENLTKLIKEFVKSGKDEVRVKLNV